MSDEQLLLAISDMLDQKFDERLDSFDKRLDSFDKRLDSFDERLVSVERRLDSFDERLVSVEGRLAPVEKELVSINNRLDRIESDTSALQAGQRDIRKDMREIHAKINETYDIALEAFGTSIENRTWLEKSKLPI